MRQILILSPVHRQIQQIFLGEYDRAFKVLNVNVTMAIKKCYGMCDIDYNNLTKIKISFY